MFKSQNLRSKFANRVCTAKKIISRHGNSEKDSEQRPGKAKSGAKAQFTNRQCAFGT
jgi:hypothetical protein